MIGQQLIDAVHKEAQQLKANATPDELAYLDLDCLYPEQWTRCIYGQMTGDCRSKRAATLITQCAPLVIVGDEITCKLPRGNKKNIKNERQGDARTVDAYSPIEVYILEEDADIAQLVSYLKGDRKKLDLSKSINC